MRNEDILMTFLEWLSPSYEQFITALEIVPAKELTMEYVMTR